MEILNYLAIVIRDTIHIKSHEKVYLWANRKSCVVDFPVDCNLKDQYPDITKKISTDTPQFVKEGRCEITEIEEILKWEK